MVSLHELAEVSFWNSVGGGVRFCWTSGSPAGFGKCSGMAAAGVMLWGGSADVGLSGYARQPTANTGKRYRRREAGRIRSAENGCRKPDVCTCRSSGTG